MYKILLFFIVSISACHAMSLTDIEASMSFEALVECGRKIINDLQRESDKSQFLDAAHNGESRELKFWLKNAQVNPNTRDTYGETALMLIHERGTLDDIDMLMRYGADVNARDDGGFTALDYAVQENKLTHVQKLYTYGADIHTGNLSPISLDCAKFLLFAGANPYASTPLLTSVQILNMLKKPNSVSRHEAKEFRPVVIERISNELPKKNIVRNLVHREITGVRFSKPK